MPELNKNWRAERARREAYRAERERVIREELQQQLARVRQDAMRHPPPPGRAAEVRGELRPRLLDANIDPRLGYGRPPLLPLPPPPPQYDNAAGREGLYGQVGRGGFKGLKRGVQVGIGDFLGGVRGGRVAKRGGG